MLHSILYKSKADSTFNNQDIEQMLQEAKKFNKNNEITGMILFYKSYFIQLIEGKKEVVEALYSRIKKDERHHDVETILSQPTNLTLWSDWSMAFYDFSEPSEQSTQLRLLLESSFENANDKEKNSEVLSTLREQTSYLLDGQQFL